MGGFGETRKAGNSTATKIIASLCNPRHFKTQTHAHTRTRTHARSHTCIYAGYFLFFLSGFQSHEFVTPRCDFPCVQVENRPPNSGAAAVGSVIAPPRPPPRNWRDLMDLVVVYWAQLLHYFARDKSTLCGKILFTRRIRFECLAQENRGSS